MAKARAYTKKELEAKIKKFEQGRDSASDDKEKAQFEKGLKTFSKKLDDLIKDVEKEVETPKDKPAPKKGGKRGTRSRKPPKKTTTTKAGTWQDFVKASKGSGKSLKELSVEWKKDKKGEGKVKEKPTKAPTKQTTTKKGKRGISVVNSKTVSVDGEEMAMDSKEFCDVLLDKWKTRRNKSKTTSKGKKTTSVMSRVTTNIEKGVKQAIKGGIDKSKKTIAKNPKPFFTKIDKLESSTKEFLSSLKAVMGAEYEQSEIAKTMKTIESFVADLKSKFEK